MEGGLIIEKQKRRKKRGGLKMEKRRKGKVQMKEGKERWIEDGGGMRSRRGRLKMEERKRRGSGGLKMERPAKTRSMMISNHPTATNPGVI